MAYTGLQLITRAYYLSQILSRDLQLPSPSQISDGLYLLNAILDYKRTDLRLIPYFTFYQFNTIVNQELYFIPNLLLIDTMTFNIGDVRYSMYETSRFEYFGTPRVDNISNLPFSYRAERVLDGMNVYMYFLPGGIYQVKIQGKFALSEVFLNTDLSQIYDLYYIEYLRHELCYYICGEWGATMPDAAYRKYEEIRKKLMEVSPKDLSIRKQTYFDGQSPIDWQYVNIGIGWLPL